MEKLEKKSYPNIGETLYQETLDNGMKVYYLPKPLFNKAYACISINYGSFDTSFTINDVIFTSPNGIAHYLEHKLFDMPDGTDAYEEMNKLGANANAFTSYDRTSYLFSSTSNFNEALKALFDFVFTPYFTDESVMKEKGIIEEEIKMYQDDPDEKNRKVLLKNMFHHHPILIDIAGDIEDIEQITKEDLYKCYDAFYRPSNMIAFFVGNFDLREAMKVIHDFNFKEYDQSQIIKNRPKYDLRVNKNLEIIHTNAHFPKVYYGIILPALDLGMKEQMKFEFSINILTELLFGTSSTLFYDLIEKKYVNDNFSIDITNLKGFNLIIGDAETRYPMELYEELKRIFYSLDEFVVDIEQFNRLKKTLAGSYIKVFNNLEAIANIFTRYKFMDLDMFIINEVFNEITIDDIYDLIKLIKKENISFLVVLPNEDENDKMIEEEKNQ